ncbi:hypothetical protein [Streptomyces sp. NPDC052721]|uniref:hypothetical protein n=1 Tax=Streptomyces sp. NPDC052721 TaxID=3154955 RepID=UPI00344A9A42
MAFDGGRVAARGFQYQYLRTVEALLASARDGKTAVCRVEGPGVSVSLQHADSVDFDLADADGRSLMAVQVKSAGAGRVMKAREAVLVLVHLVTGYEADQYRLITSAAPDEGALRLAELLRCHGGDVVSLRTQVEDLLVRAPAVWGVCQALSEQQWGRLCRADIEFDGRSDGQLREELNSALRAERESAGLGLSPRSGGLVLGYLVAEVMRRAADPSLAHWDVRDFRQAVAVGDDVLVSALGRQDLGIVYGQVPPLPEVERADLLDQVAQALFPAEVEVATDAADASAAGVRWRGVGAEGVRTCVITGLSGLGKSSLAAAHIADQGFRYDAVLWVDAESEESLVASFARVLAHLTGRAEAADVRDPRLVRERVHAELQSRPGLWLMVFDDASAPVARAWIPRRGRGRVIVTSLGGHWHGVQRLIDLSPMSSREALELLRLRLDLSESEAARYAPSLSQLARTLEYWPLALEVACGYLVSCGIELSRLSVYSDTLIQRAADDEQSVPAGYPRTLAAAVALSLERLLSRARDRGLLPPTLAAVTALCWLAPRRAPVHLALAGAFADADDLPSAGWAVLDEARLPVREVMRELLNVSLVRYDEPLPARSVSFPGSEDTVSMNTVMQDLVLRRLGAPEEWTRSGLSLLAFHTDRWLRGALLTGQAERSWELAQHATALVGRIRAAEVADGPTALLMGNLASFHLAHGQYDAAHRLLELELEWLRGAGEPDPGLAAQARTALAHLAQLRKQADSSSRVADYLQPVLSYLRGLGGVLPENVADVAAQASLILRMQLRTQPDPALQTLLEDFTSLAGTRLSTDTTRMAQDLLAIQALLGAGEAERAELATRSALAELADPWTASAADLKRLLVEALVMQDKWEEASSAFDDFLPYASPHTLHGFAVHHLVHNVGCQCAWKWVTVGERRAVELLGRLLNETSINDNPAYETAIDEARFTLLRVVHSSWRVVNEDFDHADVLRMFAQLNDKTFTEPHDPGTVWERIYSGLLPRLSAAAGEVFHRIHQEAGDAVFNEILPALKNDPTFHAVYEQAGCHAVLALSTDPLYGRLAPRSTIDLLLPEAGAFLPSARALILLQPHQMLGATLNDDGESIELQIHRACDKGLRRLNSAQATIPSPVHLTAVLTGQDLSLEHDDGTVLARATVRSSSQWRAAARARGSALVLYGYGLALHDSPAHRKLMATPAQLSRCISMASDSGLLAAALVSVRLEPSPNPPRPPQPTTRKQPRASRRAQRRNRA